MISLNGTPREGAGKNLEELLGLEGFKKNQIAVGLNGHVISKDEFANTVLKDGDVVEVFHFMGGG